MAIEGYGRIVVWEGASLWVLASNRDQGGTAAHAHHAIQITIALDGAFEIGVSDQRVTGPVAIVGADQLHVFRAAGLIAFLFVEPESPAGRSVQAAHLAGRPITSTANEALAPFIAELIAAFRDQASDSDLTRIGVALVAMLAGRLVAPVPDRRVRVMIDYVRANLDRRVLLANAAQAVSLSESHARHLFVEGTGIAFKSYLLWLRLQTALAEYAAGRSLTEAAHQAGFADSAHLSRTFRRTFGLPAAALRLISPTTP